MTITARTVIGCLLAVVLAVGCAGTRPILDEEDHGAISDSAPVPARISAILADGAGVSVQVYQLGGFATATSSDVFHNREVIATVVMDPEQARRVVKLLSEPTTYSHSHVGCVGAEGSGFSLRLERGNNRLDLDVDTLCDHIFDFDAPMNDELGLLSNWGKLRLGEAAAAALR